MPKESTNPRPLVLVASADLSAAELEGVRALASGGAKVVAWQHNPIVQDRFPSPDVRRTLEDASIESLSIAGALGEREDFGVDEAVIRWMKAFGRKRLGECGSFRDSFRLGPLVLWWWAEIYLYHETPLRLLVRDVEALSRLLEREAPSRIVLVRPVRHLEAAARGFAREVEIVGPGDLGPPDAWRTTALHAMDLLKMLGTGCKSALRRRPRPAPGSPRVFFLTHASMWRTRAGGSGSEAGSEKSTEMYFDGILPAVTRKAAASVVAFGPPVPFRKRGLRAFLVDLLELGEGALPYRPIRRYFSPRLSFSLARDFLRCWKLFSELSRAPGLDEALSHRGVSLGPVARASLRDCFLRQFPWAIRSYREVEAALRVERPDVLVLYAESSGLGRAAVAAARDRGIASVAIQHGIMYPQYYSHEHEPDEVSSSTDGVPIPSRTAVFGELAKELLTRRGSYPEDRLIVTGSPKFDALVKAAEGYDRQAIRTRTGVPEGARFVVLATRWSAVGPVFAELAEAVESLSGVFLVVKPHPAESPVAYEKTVAGRSLQKTRILPASASLVELLFASDGLITVDSLASSEALVLGRPVLVVNLPSNLSALVERGVALGVRRGEPIEKALRALLFDAEVGRELEEKRRQYIRDFAFGADGRSTERIVELILETAEGTR